MAGTDQMPDGVRPQGVTPEGAAPDAVASDDVVEGAAEAAMAGGVVDEDDGPEDHAPAPEADTDDLSVEALVSDLERVSSERDEYLDALRRIQAEFENYRKAVAKREVDARERANDRIVVELLPVIDACDGAIANGADDVAPIRSAIVDTLSKLGLVRLDPAGKPFDPEQHEAVMHEDSPDYDQPTVAEVLRVGYGWNGRTLRAAMVKTIG